MGCDIHLFSEVRRNGKWEPAVPFILSEWWYDQILDEWTYDSIEYKIQENKFKNMSQKQILEKYGDDLRVLWVYPLDRTLGNRNYNFFAILANVRNNRGFADIYTGNGFSPISMPRGLPDDVSMEIKRQSDKDSRDGHSHSYLTLKELLEYDWEQKTIQHGLVTERIYARMLDSNSNNLMSWAGMIYDPIVKQVSNNEMEDLISGKIQKEPHKKYVTEYEWCQTYREAVGEEYLEELCTELAHYGKPDDVRIVFWFDN